jgi:hypothetical protein
MDRIALQILEDGWEQDGRAMRRAVGILRDRLAESTDGRWAAAENAAHCVDGFDSWCRLLTEIGDGSDFCGTFSLARATRGASIPAAKNRLPSRLTVGKRSKSASGADCGQPQRRSCRSRHGRTSTFDRFCAVSPP